MPYKIEVYSELKKTGKLDTSAIIAESVNTLYKNNE
jgi:shikimate 5-dehydrogenase